MSVGPTPTVVIGLGNPLRHDDGIGPVIAGILDGDTCDPVDVITLDGDVTRLIEAWRDRATAIVIDAVVTGDPPGTIHEIEMGRDAMPEWDTSGGTHGAGIAEAVALGRVLDRLPEELVVLGVEPGDLSHGPGLSDDVAAALPAVVERVRARVAP